ncbi:hypothetical protein D0Z07_2325 [Hyphodiscus hymeniophilus]|uniref:AB hydrolase-1 domain-containing protein n=1 Tax=Hyphodiscus hymeniophilus TaxID=353542 RepID=A0A9P7AZB8_9HELO|nr:hypothetical protein D0Z07_2325 [Hyphodiscus hymeniophilus]
MSKPSILLITGSFASPELYDDVVNPVAAKGYEIRALHSPSVGLSAGTARDGDPPTMYEDAAFIAKETEKLADEGKDVVLIAHSYGGVPTTQSTKGLAKEEREKEGKKGGVVRIAYMTCLVPEVGLSAASVLQNVPEEHKINLPIDVRCLPTLYPLVPLTREQENGWMYHDPISKSAAISFSDLPLAEGEAWVRRFSKHSAISFAGELTYAGYKDIPVSYLLCEEDICIPIDIQKSGIKMIENVSGRKVEVTSINTGHCPMASKPEEVINWILDVAGNIRKDP